MKISLRKYAEALCDSLMNEKDDKVVAKKIQNFLKLLTKRKEGKLIKQLPASFEAVWLKKHNKMKVTAVLPHEPSKEEIKNIAKLLTESFNKEVIVSIRTNPQVIGGMKLEFDDCIVDNTVAASLLKLKQHLTHNS